MNTIIRTFATGAKIVDVDAEVNTEVGELIQDLLRSTHRATKKLIRAKLRRRGFWMSEGYYRVLETFEYAA